jgi:hypothetical protein
MYAPAAADAAIAERHRTLFIRILFHMVIFQLLNTVNRFGVDRFLRLTTLRED